MFHVLVADDEPITRKYLANNIPALCPDFQVTGLACDGLEAIELCKKQYFDLVITDIRMPEMDGLGLCKYLFESGIDTKMVILSGYNEFEYARSALRYQVSDYILKPVNDENLKSLLFGMADDLTKKCREASRLSSLEFEEISSFQLYCELLQNIISQNEKGIYSVFSVLEDRSFHYLETIGCIVRLTILDLRLLFIKDNQFDFTTHHLKLLKICQQYCCSKELPFMYDHHNGLMLLVSAGDEKALLQKTESIYSDIELLCRKEGIPQIEMTCGSILTDILDAENSGQCAFEAYSLTLLLRKNFISFTDYKNNLSFIKELQNVCEALYLAYLKSDEEELKKLLPSFCKLLPFRESAAGVLNAGCYLIRYICDRANIKTHYTRAAYQNLLDSVNSLLASNSFSDPQTCLAWENSLSCLMHHDHTARPSEINQLADAARQYIYAHFDEPLSLSGLADSLHVNSCYLSDVIHKSLGESYSKFLLRVRMERAVTIMKNNPNEKIYQIAEKVGFVSPKHFISVFKKTYGVTPAAYMAQI